jgi:hypothetical protein
MTAVVIKFERPAQRQAALGVELPIFLAPTVEGFRQKLYSDAFFELPFVTLPSEECASWGKFCERANMWNDGPTGDGCADCQRVADTHWPRLIPFARRTPVRAV